MRYATRADLAALCPAPTLDEIDRVLAAVLADVAVLTAAYDPEARAINVTLTPKALGLVPITLSL